jgi:membrane protease YdiL (CAAX protease family)
LSGGDGRYTTGLMWCPGLAALVTCRAKKIPIASLGWQWAGLRYQAASYLIPPAYALVAYIFIWSTGWGAFPNPKFLTDAVTSIGIKGTPPWADAALLIVLHASFGFVRACSSALGEEIGWRGFLTPHLTAKLGFRRASVLTGLIWAIWHYPILLFADYNTGTPGWYALTCFTVMIVAMSVIYAWFRLKTGSLWTATFLHASHNLVLQTILTPLTADTGRTAYAIDEFGFVLPVVVVVATIWFWRRGATELEQPAS